MTDYLSAVARRAIGGPTDIRPAEPPRIPPAHETAQGAEAAAVGRPEFVNDLPAATRTVPRATRIEPRAEPVKPARAPLEPALVEPAKQRRGRGRPSRAPADRGRTDGAVPWQAVETDAAPPGVAASRQAAPGAPEPAHRADGQLGTPSRPHPTTPREVAVEAEASPVAATAPARGRAPEPMRTEAPVWPLAAIARRAVDQPWGPSRPDDGDDIPVVHVSIGRVEVRAAAPPAARPVPAPIAPRLTLDAYLRRRESKGRRP